ncbi:MAG TPA: carboxypeptidase regulatory-like domain-containing protein, partial [Thermoplasmata archaeon]|nr:carboxypeptidase regulatory-like domain-containing protein [Thermoplasmata archaeon]
MLVVLLLPWGGIPVGPSHPGGAPSPTGPSLASAAEMRDRTLNPATASVLPGSDPSREPFVAAPAIALEILDRMARDHPGPAPPPAPVGAPRALARPVPSTPNPSATNGRLVGQLADRETGRPVANANLVLALVVGGCPGYLCPNGNSSATGTFLISAPAGVYTVTISAQNYTTNDTQVTISSGVTTSLGTIYLLEDSYVTGVLLGSDPSHEPIGGAAIIGTSRNSVLAGPQGTSGSNGSFTALVPSGADRIDLDPPAYAPYESNHTFADPRPGQTVNLGTIFLLRGTQLDVKLLDRVTHRPIGPAFGSEEIACQAQTGDCPLPDTITNGPNVTVFAVPGPTQLHAVVEGYVVNVTPIGIVPARPTTSSGVVDVNLTPLG